MSKRKIIVTLLFINIAAYDVFNNKLAVTRTKMKLMRANELRKLNFLKNPKVLERKEQKLFDCDHLKIRSVIYDLKI